MFTSWQEHIGKSFDVFRGSACESIFKIIAPLAYLVDKRERGGFLLSIFIIINITYYQFYQNLN